MDCDTIWRIQKVQSQFISISEQFDVSQITERCSIDEKDKKTACTNGNVDFSSLVELLSGISSEMFEIVK